MASEKDKMRGKITWHMVESGKIQVAMLQFIRALLAIGVTTVFCYRELCGDPVSEQFALIVVMILTLYFKDGSSAMIPMPHGGEHDELEEKEEKFLKYDPDPEDGP